MLALLLSMVEGIISDDRLEFALYTLLLAVGLAIAIVQFGRRLARRETQRNQAMKKLEAGNSAVWEMNVASGRIIQSNRSVYRGLGYALGELS